VVLKDQLNIQKKDQPVIGKKLELILKEDIVVLGLKKDMVNKNK